MPGKANELSQSNLLSGYEGIGLARERGEGGMK